MRKEKAKLNTEVVKMYYKNNSFNFEIAKGKAIWASFAFKTLVTKAIASVCDQLWLKRKRQYHVCV